MQRSLTAVTGVLLWVGTALAAASQPEIYQAASPDGTLIFTDAPTHPRFKKFDAETCECRPRVSEPWLERVIASQARRYGIHPALLRAVIKTESNFDPVAVSRSGAIGLMQLMPETAAKLGVQNPYDPEDNMQGGARHLRHLLDRYRGNLRLTLAAYNAGEHRVDRYRRLPPFAETHRYVTTVLRYYRHFLREAARHPRPAASVQAPRIPPRTLLATSTEPAR